MRDKITQNTKKTETKRGILISRKPKKRLSQTKNKNLPLEQVLHLQRTIGNRAVNRLIKSGAIQAKLTIGKPNDIYEKEADRVADRVMSMKDGALVNGHSSLAQRQSTEEKEKEGIRPKPLAEQITPLVQREATGEDDEKVEPKLMDNQQLQREAAPDDEEKKEETNAQGKFLSSEQPSLQREEEPAEEKKEEEGPSWQKKEAAEEDKEQETPVSPKASPGGTPKVTPNIESSINAMKGGGQPLSKSARAFFEPRFGTDFSQVRVHNDSRAANTAQAINAKAFTTGKDIVFGSGQYSPGTTPGKNLLAHELTHVVQQGNDKISKKEIRLLEEPKEPKAPKDPITPKGPKVSSVSKRPNIEGLKYFMIVTPELEIVVKYFKWVQDNIRKEIPRTDEDEINIARIETLINKYNGYIEYRKKRGLQRWSNELIRETKRDIKEIKKIEDGYSFRKK